MRRSRALLGSGAVDALTEVDASGCRDPGSFTVRRVGTATLDDRATRAVVRSGDRSAQVLTEQVHLLQNRYLWAVAKRNLARGLAQVGALAAVLLAANTAANLRQVRHLRPDPAPGPEPSDSAGRAAQPAWRPNSIIEERVSVLIPARNEAARIGACVAAVLAQRGVPDLEVLILDDGSTDGTGAIAERAAEGDPRVKVIYGEDVAPPTGWRGKPWACHRLAEHATGSVLAFIDADVILHPSAIGLSVSALRADGLQLVSPYPRQLAHGAVERLAQPLVTWSAFASLPMSLAKTGNPAFSAAIGQFLVVDAAAYREAGGHEAVAGEVVEDVEVLRALKRSGYRGMPMIGGQIAQCRMYECPRDLYEGYAKSLWSIFANEPGAVGGMATMLLLYVVPPAVALTSRDRGARAWGAVGYAAGVASRAMVARANGERVWPDALTQPASMTLFAGMLAASVVRRRRGTLTWKGRSV